MTDDVRLPRTIRPLRYRLELDVDLEAARFDGDVTVLLEVLEPTDVIVCHAHHLDISEVAVEGATVLGHELIPEMQTLRIHLDRTLPTGLGSLRIKFTGELNGRLVGFYRSNYDDDAGSHTLAVTQFEAPFARECFPCWDEPDRKATFEAHLTVDEGLLAIANAAEVSRREVGAGRVRVSFAETMPLPTYLVAFVVGRLEATEPRMVEGVPVRIVHRPGQGHLCDEALAIAEHSIRWFSEYYGIPYPGDKLDLVAVPDFAFGAMENLGCVTFREALLLLDPVELTQPELERATLVIAHELAHMWFGDLVTMQWWDGIWLNEAFATFMEMACVDAYRPEWGVWRTFGMARREAFETDALASTRPIHYEVNSPQDAEGMFDILTYEKGAAVLRMMEQHLGEAGFRDGIRRYLAKHSYGNTEMSDLWAALDEVSDAGVGAVMDSWILQGGHPLITATVRDDGLELAQRRMSFIGGGEPERATFAVPMRIRATVGGSEIERAVLVDSATQFVDLGGHPSEISLNVDATGFYRWRLDDMPAVVSLSTSNPAERFDVVDSAWALTLAGEQSLAEVVATLRAVLPDDDPSIWRRSAAIIHAIALLGGPANSALVEDFTAALVEPLLAEVTEPERRGILLRIAGLDGNSDRAISEARALLANGSESHPELLAASIDIVAAHGTPADYDRFVSRYREADSPQEVLRYLGALTHLSDPELFGHFLDLCAAEVRTQNAPYTLAQAMANRHHGVAAWNLVRSRWDELNERFPSNSIVRMVAGVRSIFDPAAAEDVTAFFATHELPQATQPLAQHLEIVAVHQALRARELPALVETLRS
ncbi:MAG: M1 family metallopeptidase [Microthrixaceae bacterium]|nr:M1 family metallopeptidase [Microthrixaceae bacterium]